MWFIYALLGAIGKSYAGFFRKKIAKSVSASMYMWVGLSLVLLFLTPFMVPKFSEIASVLVNFPLIVAGAALANLVATQLNLEALKREDLSYIAPLNAFVPVFTLLLAALFLDETPPKFGIWGIIIVVIGAYIVSIRPERIHWYDPLKRLVTSIGALLSIAVALCYAINTILIKELTNNGYGALSLLYVTTLIAWLCLAHVPLSKRSELRAIGRSDKLAVLGGGVSTFAGSFFHILAIANTYTSYATSVRRLDALFSVLLGWRYLKEKGIRIKLIGSVVMIIGSVVMFIA